MKWCRRCILPDTRPNLALGADGVCNACKAHESKARIDWPARARAFRRLAEQARTRRRFYDCVIPVSGGKDSTWQVVTCLEHGLTPLCVTWRPPGRTEIGARNLANLIALGVDHIDWSINPAVEAALTLKAFERFGSTAIPMHMAIFAMPLTVALRFDIPLIVWGENAAFEYGAADEAHTGFALDAEWLRHYGVTHGTTASDWVGPDLSEKRLAAWFPPPAAQIARAGLRAVFLGWYFAWDPEMTRRVAARHGFTAEPAGARTGHYAFADIDDAFISVHHWMKWYKFGFTRLFDNLSLEIRNGRMSRDQALALAARAGEQRPAADIARLCAFLGIGEARFQAIAERFRNPAIWRRGADGRWTIPDFPIAGWDWP